MPYHHDHGPRPAAPGEMPFEQKMATLLQHWRKHNQDHAATYKDWAQKARSRGLDRVAAVLDDVHESTLAINERFEEALKALK